MKTNSNKPLAKVFHAEIQGKRNEKYEYLLNNSIDSVQWQQLDYKAPYHFFVPKDFNEEKEYELGFKVEKLFIVYSNGIETQKDSVNIFFSKEQAKQLFNDFLVSDEINLKIKYDLEEGRDWKVINAKRDLQKNICKITNIQYRPFDFRYTNYTGTTKGIMAYPRNEVMKNLLHPNIGLIIPRQTTQDYRHSFISNKIIEGNITASAKLFGTGCVFPLYLYPDSEKDGMYANAERTPNLNMEIVNKIAEGLGLEFVPEKEATANTFAPIDILDYIYAVLHSPTYRETYKEFLKIDFPRVPYPIDKEQFWKLVQLGGEIRQIHLLESPIVEDYITEYPEDGTNEVEKIKYEGGRVYINSTQYFDNVPEVAWNFYIGGYQPAQKWLKDRKGRVLNFDDILHYQKIIVALTETDRLMKAVDEVMKEEIN